MEYALEINHLKKNYIDFHLNDVSVKIPKGTIMGLIGENGAGKSTIINTVLNIAKKDAGEVKVFNKDIEKCEKEIKEDLAVIFDECHYNPNFKCKTIGKFMSKIYKNWQQETFDNYLIRFELPTEKKIKDFSKGMKMKLAFAVALSHQAKFLILDEATSGLDPVVRDEILDILKEFVMDENNTVLISSHITSDLDKISDYISFLHNGELIFTKTYEDIQDHYGVIKCGSKIFESVDKNEIIAYKKEDFEYRLLVQDRHTFAKVYQDVVIEKASLEDIMLFYIKGVRS